MSDELSIDPSHTAFLVMDCQREIVENFVPDQEALLTAVGEALQGARDANLLIIHVTVAFREGYPEVSARNKGWSGLAATGRFREGTPGVEIHPALAARSGEVVVTKRRIDAFSSGDLSQVLRARDIDTLVLTGVATAGVVLSTVRTAADLDYRLVVLADCCADPDEEVHRVLLQKVFPRQAVVVNSDEFLRALAPTR